MNMLRCTYPDCDCHTRPSLHEPTYCPADAWSDTYVRADVEPDDLVTRRLVGVLLGLALGCVVVLLLAVVL